MFFGCRNFLGIDYCNTADSIGQNIISAFKETFAIETGQELNQMPKKLIY